MKQVNRDIENGPAGQAALSAVLNALDERHRPVKSVDCLEAETDTETSI